VEIMTDRLLLREFTQDDARAFLAYQADPRYAEFYGPEESAPDHARELLHLFSTWASERPRRNYQLAVAELRNPRQLLGCCGLRLKGLGAGTAEFGLELAAESWGHGYATEAARALLGFGFRELRLDEVRSESVSANARVVALAQRIGLVEIGTRPGPAWMSARGWHHTEWQLTRGRWEGALCAPI
jgi:RimJ/RimL family protein N-acetyltransferase